MDSKQVKRENEFGTGVAYNVKYIFVDPEIHIGNAIRTESIEAGPLGLIRRLENVHFKGKLAADPAEATYD